MEAKVIKGRDKFVIDSGLDVNHEVLRITDPSKAKFKTKREIEAAKESSRN